MDISLLSTTPICWQKNDTGFSAQLPEADHSQAGSPGLGATGATEKRRRERPRCPCGARRPGLVVGAAHFENEAAELLGRSPPVPAWFARPVPPVPPVPAGPRLVCSAGQPWHD